MTVAVPLAVTRDPELVESQSAFAKQLKRYQSIRSSLLPDQARHYDSEVQRRLTQEFPPDLAAWGKYFFPHYLTMPPSGMHKVMVKHLQWSHKKRKRKRCIIAPRSGAKTTWVSKLYVLFCICLDLEHYIMLIGDSSEQSFQNLAAIKKELEENQALAEAYPHACGQGERWNQSYIITKNGIKVEALGTRKKVRGRSHGQYRPGLIVIDDLENDDGVQSEGMRTRVWNWLTRSLLPCGAPDCNVVAIGTALHPEDALQVLKEQPGWETESFAALIHEPTRLDLWEQWRLLYRDASLPPIERAAKALRFYLANEAEMKLGAELLWPERESLYDLMLYREDNGERSFQAEKQGNAAAMGATEFPSEYLKGADLWFDVWPDLTLKAMALDPSKGQNEKNDYSAYVYGGLGLDGNIYIDADLERRDASQVVEDGIRLYRDFMPNCFGLETVMFLSLFQDMFQMQAKAQGLVIPITAIHSHENKAVRIRQLTPYLNGRQLRFRSGSRGAEMLVDQLRYFPTHKHDDGPDALHMMISLLSWVSTGANSGADGLSVATG